MKVEMSFQFFPDEICNQFSICEAAKKASEMGEVGRIIAKAAGENIANRFNDDSLRVAMDLGIDDQNCKQKFECKKKILEFGSI